jgi:hypothetical protein
MKLTNKDKDYLISIGYSDDELFDIEDATNNMKYTLFFENDEIMTEIKITKKQVIDMIGRNAFLSGLGRATLHRTAVRYIPKISEVAISFEYTKWGQ